MAIEFAKFLVDITPVIIVVVLLTVTAAIFLTGVAIEVKRVYDYLRRSPRVRFALIVLVIIGFLAYHMGAFPMEWYAYLGMPRLLTLSEF